MNTKTMEHGHTLRNFIIAAPLILAVPLIFVSGYSLFGVSVVWETFGIGALGWLIALILRAPVAALSTRLSTDSTRAQHWVAGASGPLEELARFAALMIVGRSLSAALSLGLGWAAIEVLFAVVNGAVVLSLLRRGGDEAEKIRAALEAQGMWRESGPFWGIFERISASAIHIGFTLIIAAMPILVAVTIPVHSAINLIAARLISRSIGATQAALFGIGVVLLAVGLTLHGALYGPLYGAL